MVLIIPFLAIGFLAFCAWYTQVIFFVFILFGGSVNFLNILINVFYCFHHTLQNFSSCHSLPNLQSSLHIFRHLLQQHSTSKCQNLYYFPMASVTNYYRLSGLKWYKFGGFPAKGLDSASLVRELRSTTMRCGQKQNTNLLTYYSGSRSLKIIQLG